MHHKFHGLRFGNNSHAKSTFHRFVWNRHEYHSPIYIVWTLKSCTFDTNDICQFVFFIYWCCMFICVVYIWKLCTWQLPCLNNAQQSCLSNMNPWNNRFHMDLEQNHEACKFVMWRHNFPFWSCLKCKWGSQWFAFEFWWFFLQKWLLLNIFI
jgi:hypothetical protein